MKLYDEPAYPRNYSCDGHNGMTILDHFAGQALTGIMANPNNCNNVEYFAKDAYKMARAMMAEKHNETNCM